MSFVIMAAVARYGNRDEYVGSTLEQCHPNLFETEAMARLVHGRIAGDFEQQDVHTYVADASDIYRRPIVGSRFRNVDAMMADDIPF